MKRPTEDGQQVIRKALICAFNPGEINVSIVLFVSKNHTVHRFNIVEYHTNTNHLANTVHAERDSVPITYFNFYTSNFRVETTY